MHFSMPLTLRLVVGMNTGTGNGRGMGMGTGKGALYILTGVGRWMGTGTGTGTGCCKPSVWVSLWHGCGLQETPLDTIMGRVMVALFLSEATSAGSTVVSLTTSRTVWVWTGICCCCCWTASEDTAEMTGIGEERGCSGCVVAAFVLRLRQLREQ